MKSFFKKFGSRLVQAIIIFCAAALPVMALAAGADLTLPGMVQEVKGMLGAGKPRAEIAQWINARVDERLVALNLDTPDERQMLSPAQYNQKKSVFDAWSDQGLTYQTDEPYVAAHWVWENGFGHCQEHAHTVFHILMMALEKGDNIGDYAWGDHAFVIWGLPDGFQGNPTLEVMKGWNNAFLIDPWLGACFPTNDARFFKWYQERGGSAQIERVAAYPYKVYQKRYEMWLNKCPSLAGSYGAESEELVVTDVLGNSNIALGQIQKIRPAGDFKVTQNQCDVTVSFKAGVLTGRATGFVAGLTNVVSGALTKASICAIKIAGQDKLLVRLVGKSPQTGATIIREGLLSKI